MKLSDTSYPFPFPFCHSWLSGFCPHICYFSVQMAAISLAIISTFQAKKKASGREAEVRRMCHHSSLYIRKSALSKKRCSANFHFYLIGQGSRVAGDTGSALLHCLPSLSCMVVSSGHCWCTKIQTASCELGRNSEFLLILVVGGYYSNSILIGL